MVVFDKGYSAYGWHKTLTDNGIYFVTRMRSNAKYRIIERRAFSTGNGVTSDQVIEFSSDRPSKKRLQLVRRIGNRDAESGRHYVFISNQFDWSAKTIAESISNAGRSNALKAW